MSKYLSNAKKSSEILEDRKIETSDTNKEGICYLVPDFFLANFFC